MPQTRLSADDQRKTVCSGLALDTNLLYTILDGYTQTQKYCHLKKNISEYLSTASFLFSFGLKFKMAVVPSRPTSRASRRDAQGF